MKIYLHRIGFLLAFISFIVCAVQSQTFEVYLGGDNIQTNVPFDVRFVLKGKKGTNFTPPSFGKLQLVGGPQTFQQQSFSNRKATFESSWTYTLMATEPGRYIIGPATVRIGNKTLKTKTSKVDIKKGAVSKTIEEDNRKIYVKIEASDTTAMIGQQITVTYKLYTQMDVTNYNILNESDYDGFYAQELRNYKANVVKEIVDGEEMWTKTIRKIALFPQRTGEYEINPVIVNLTIPLPGQKKRSIWSPSRGTTKRVTTNGLRLQINSAPPNAPVSFSGAVGKYRMATQINKTKITTDDAFVINMELRGTGDGKTFSAPNQPKMNNMEFYDPNVVRDEDTSRDGVISNYKQIEYLIVPKKPGNYVIKPEFTYYDADSNDFVTLAPKAFRVQVTQGNRKIIEDDRDVSVTQDFFPDRKDASSLSRFSISFFDPLWYASASLGFCSLLFMGFKRYKEYQADNIDPQERKRREAQKLAESKLLKAKSFLDAGSSRKFYEELSSAMNGYLGNKCGLANSDFQKDKIVASLKSNNYSENQISSYLEILKSCELAIFAGQSSSKMEDLYSKASDLILSLEAG